MDISLYRKVIRKSLWIITLAVLVGLASAAYYTLSLPPQYESSTTLLLNPALPSAYAPYLQTEMAANLAGVYSRYMSTPTFGEAVAKKLPFPVSAEGVTRAVSGHPEPNTLLYKITGTMPTPEQAQQLTNAAADQLLSSNAGQPGQNNDSPAAQMNKRLNDRLQSLDTQIKSYQQQIADLEKQPPAAARDSQLLQLKGQLVILQDSETVTMLAIAQTSNQALPTGTATVIQQALPGTPVSGELVRNLAMALLVSLLVGVGIVLLRNYLADGIDSPQRLRKVLGIAPLTAIGIVGESWAQPRDNNNNSDATTRPADRGLVTLEHPYSPEAESFRVLRTNIRFTSPDKPLRSLVVTSATDGEGKSFAAANLAIVMAQAGKRVILVDANLRNPILHSLFGLSNHLGFTNLILNGLADLERAIQPVPGVENLVVIASGPLPANPPQLLDSHLAEKLMEELKQVAELVIYDAPPAGVVDDPIILGAHAGEVLLVVRADSARRDAVARVKRSLLKAGVRAVLPVLNRVKTRKLRGYSYRYYGSDTLHTRETPANARRPYTNGKVPAGAVSGKSRPAEEVSVGSKTARQ